MARVRPRALPQEQEKKDRIPFLAGGINSNVSPSDLPANQSPLIENMIVVQGGLVPDTGYEVLGSGVIEGTPQACFQVNHAGGNVDTLLITTKRGYYLDRNGVWIDGGIALEGQISLPVNVVSYPPYDWVVITNGFDPVFYFYLGAYQTVPFDIPGLVCRSLGVFHESLVLHGTIEEDGAHPRRVRASDAGNPTAVKTIIEGAITGVAAIYDLLDTDDDIHCGFTLGPWYILYRHSSIMRATYLGALNAILLWEYMITGDGAISVNGACPITIPKQTAYHVVVGTNDVYRYEGGYALTPVAEAIWKDQFGANSGLNQQAKSTIWTQYVPQWDEVWIGVPTDESTIPDTVLRVTLGGQPAWFKRRFADKFISAGTLTTRFGENQDVPGVFLAGPSGVMHYDFVTNADNGLPIKWRFETKDIGDGNVINRFDRLLVRGFGAYDIGVEVSLDRGESWQFVDTINFALASTAVLTFSFASSYMRVRLSGSDPSFRLVWLEVWYIYESEWTPIHVVSGKAAVGPQLRVS